MTSERVLNVVGVGEVAMNTHLPNLLLCSHMFKATALVDVSNQALAHASAKFHIPKTYLDIAEMLDDCPDVDIVMVMSADEYHVSHTVAALQAGKHVFIEKPMALTLSGADEIAAAQKASGKVVFVGYMRRYAEAYLRVKDIVHAAPKGGITYGICASHAKLTAVRVRDIIGKNEFFVSQSGAYPLKFTDTPGTAVQDRSDRRKDMYTEALGPRAQNELDRRTYGLITGLSSHDISAMRELIGMPKRAIGASRSPDGNWIWAMLDYDGFVAYYEVGIDDVRVFDAHIEVYMRDKRVKVTYDTPYVKGLPITATIQSTRPNGDHSEEVIRPTYLDAFTLEYAELYDAVVQGKAVKTTPEDAKEDLVVFKMIMEAIWAAEAAS